MEEEIVFKPTPGMMRCKAALHKSCHPTIVRALTPGSQDIPKHIAPTPMVQLRKWLSTHGDRFWEYLVTPIEEDGLALRARDIAYASLIEILELQIKDGAGMIDHDVLKAKQKAIDTVLAKNVPLVAIQNNSVSEEKLPIGMTRQSSYQLQERMNALRRHIPSGDESMMLAGNIIEGEQE